MKRFPALILAGVFLASTAFSQNMNAAELDALHWRLIDSFCGGR